MNPNKALWEKGDFTEIAAFMRESDEQVVQSIGVTPSLRVLDLGLRRWDYGASVGPYGSGRDGDRHCHEPGGRREPTSIGGRFEQPEVSGR